MDGFFEANRLVEVSMMKLNSLHKGGELPLRQTLLVSKVLNKAQNVATSAHYSFLHASPKNPTPRSSSKLLASISKKVEDPSSTCFEDDCLPPSSPTRISFKPQREPSPMVSCSVSHQETGEEAMDFESVHSVLSDILSDGEMDNSSSGMDTRSPCAKILHEDVADKNNRQNEARRNSLLSNNANTESSSGWSAWKFDLNSEFRNSLCWSTEPSPSQKIPPVSPGKRNREAFLVDKENLILTEGIEDSKRFKPSPPEGCPLENLPGFCGHLSPKNLQSAPLITYMSGKGFAHPSNPSSCDWPPVFSSAFGSEQRLMDNSGSPTQIHFLLPIHTSSVKFNPILAF
jgi:hypothetical protein